jgi:uncharacterized protein YneF (UPF0154 family)
MTFHISEALLFERAIVVCVTILLFGVVSIGGLWLWRKSYERNARSNPILEAGMFSELVSDHSELFSDEFLRTVESIEAAARQAEVTIQNAEQLKKTTRELPQTLRNYLIALSEVRLRR